MSTAAPTTSASVWIQLYIGEQKSGDVELVVLRHDHLVAHLRRAVKDECKPKLDYCAAADLTVYAPGTAVPVPEGAESIHPGDEVPGGATSKQPLIVVAPQPQPQPLSIEQYRPAFEYAMKQLDAQTEARHMSKASFDFARVLLNGMSIHVKVDSVNFEQGASDNPTPFDWTVETKQDQTVRPGQHYQTPGAMKWFAENFLAHDEVWGLKVVTGHPLPELKANGKKASGKADLVIGKKREIQATDDPYDFAFGLIELKQDNNPIKKGQNVLELASVCTISRVGQNCALLASDCRSKWELYCFEDTKTIVRRVYEHGRKCWEDFKALLDVAEMKILEPPSQIRPVLPNYEEALDDKVAQGFDEQNLDGFIGAGDTKLAAVDRHAQLNALANWLGDLYGERPVIPEWATAERNCPNYYL